MRNVNHGIVEAQKYSKSSMAGVGITPEGINQNYVMYEFALDRAWYQNEVNVSDWINQYIEVRYGFHDDNLSLAWEKIRVIDILEMPPFLSSKIQNGFHFHLAGNGLQLQWINSYSRKIYHLSSTVDQLQTMGKF